MVLKMYFWVDLATLLTFDALVLAIVMANEAIAIAEVEFTKITDKLGCISSMSLK